LRVVLVFPRIHAEVALSNEDTNSPSRRRRVFVKIAPTTGFRNEAVLTLNGQSDYHPSLFPLDLFVPATAMRRNPYHARLALCLLGVAFALRLVGGYWWQARLPDGQRFAFGDSESYWVLGQTIVRGQPYQYGEQMQVFRTPGYPALLAGLFALVGDDPPVLWARALGAACGTIAVGGVIGLTWLLFDPRSALLAGVLAGLYPGAISLSVFVLSEAPFCPLLMLQLICWVVSVRSGSQQRSIFVAALGGLVAGLATLMRPSWLLFTPGAALLEILAFRDSWRHARVGATMSAALALTLLPWWIRNYEVTGRLVPTTLQVGASLYDGLSPTASGASDMRFVEKFYQEQLAADARQSGELSGTFEYRLDRRMHGAAVEWATQHPARVLRLMGVKLVRMWSPWPNAADLQSWAFRAAVALTYTPLFVFGMWGGWAFWRRGWPYVLCLLPAAYFTCLHLVFVSSIRYREPAMLPLIVLSAGLVGSGWQSGSRSPAISRANALSG
jgi:4-amino-4-deoxy-L-arabinose transferase-like glycosyltransferase